MTGHHRFRIRMICRQRITGRPGVDPAFHRSAAEDAGRMFSRCGKRLPSMCAEEEIPVVRDSEKPTAIAWRFVCRIRDEKC